MKNIVNFLIIFLLTAVCVSADSNRIGKLINDFVLDYNSNDQMPIEPIAFGIEIIGPGGGKWSIHIDPKEGARLIKGFPNSPSFYVVTDLKTFQRIHSGKLNALTAGGRARMSDKVPLDFGFMEGFKASPDFVSRVMLPLGFHFFTRGKPEIVPFGEEYSRYIHGGNSVIFYYQKGLRTAWYQVKKGMFINKDLKDAVNTFPTLLIITKGKGKGRLGKKELVLKEGMTLYIPAGMVHQFWSHTEGGFEAVIIMFGEGA